ncbi:MAG: ribonuclease HII [Parasphingorhabdus sp.]|jgi:ribonuclease HII
MRIVAGVDEAGRGPLAGPVVAAAVVVTAHSEIQGLDDSKKLSPKRRAELDLQIRAKADFWCISMSSPAEIDTLNIHFATLLAMRRAILGLKVVPNFIKVDGKFLPDVDINGEAIIKGDSSVAEISAASIIAKQYRDRYMTWLDTIYPQYGFGRHKGYPTKEHQVALKDFGATRYHRFSYAPVRLAAT